MRNCGNFQVTLIALKVLRVKFLALSEIFLRYYLLLTVLLTPNVRVWSVGWMAGLANQSGVLSTMAGSCNRFDANGLGLASALPLVGSASRIGIARFNWPSNPSTLQYKCSMEFNHNWSISILGDWLLKPAGWRWRWRHRPKINPIVSPKYFIISWEYIRIKPMF